MIHPFSEASGPAACNRPEATRGVGGLVSAAALPAVLLALMISAAPALAQPATSDYLESVLLTEPTTDAPIEIETRTLVELDASRVDVFRSGFQVFVNLLLDGAPRAEPPAEQRFRYSIGFLPAGFTEVLFYVDGQPIQDGLRLHVAQVRSPPAAELARGDDVRPFEIDTGRFGFFPIEFRLPDGAPPGAWGVTLFDEPAGAVSAGAVLPPGGAVPGFFSFGIATAEDVAVTVFEYSGSVDTLDLVLERIVDGSRVRIVEAPATPSGGGFSASLEPGLYVLVVSNGAGAPRAQFGATIAASSLQRGFSFGGWMDDVGVGGFTTAFGSTTIRFDLVYGSNYGEVGAEEPEVAVLWDESPTDRYAIYRSSSPSGEAGGELTEVRSPAGEPLVFATHPTVAAAIVTPDLTRFLVPATETGALPAILAFANAETIACCPDPGLGPDAIPVGFDASGERFVHIEPGASESTSELIATDLASGSRQVFELPYEPDRVLAATIDDSGRTAIVTGRPASGTSAARVDLETGEVDVFFETTDAFLLDFAAEPDASGYAAIEIPSSVLGPGLTVTTVDPATGETSRFRALLPVFLGALVYRDSWLREGILTVVFDCTEFWLRQCISRIDVDQQLTLPGEPPPAGFAYSTLLDESRDGRWRLFSRRTLLAAGNQVLPGSREVWLHDAASGSATRITQASYDPFPSGRVSQDGSRVLLSDGAVGVEAGAPVGERLLLWRRETR
ncbi:MAG: hypothetical protein AAGE01_02920 [Pseudomonadota bacterium]